MLRVLPGEQTLLSDFNFSVSVFLVCSSLTRSETEGYVWDGAGKRSVLEDRRSQQRGLCDSDSQDETFSDTVW